MEKKIRILLIEDNPGDADLVKEYLREDPAVQYELDWADRVEKALQFIKQGKTYDVILLDLTLPDSSGYESFQKVYDFGQDTSIIILTSLEDQELTFRALRNGAQDYVFKGHVDSYSLHRAISFAIERKKSAQELMDKEVRLQLLTGQLPAILWTTDTQLNLTSILGAALKDINVKPNELNGMPLTTFFRDNEDFAPMNVSKKALEGKSGSFELQWGNSTFQSYVEPFFDFKRNIVGTIGVALNITEWKKVAEELVRRSEEKYSRLFRHSNDGIFIYDLEGHILDINLKGMNLLGYTKPEIFSLKLTDFHPPDSLPVFQDALKKVIDTGFVSYEIFFQKRTGNLFPAEVSASTIEISDKIVVQAVVRDITERKKAEDRLRKANEELRKLNQLKSEFVSTVSHEFRTPLTIIVQANEILSSEGFGKITDQQRVWLHRIDENASRLQKLLTEILDLSKLQSGKVDMTRELVDLKEIITGLTDNFETLAEQKKISLRTDFVEPINKVWANHTRIEQVVNNLVGNAIKFTPEGGDVNVTAEQVDGNVKVTVTDTGPGIKPENLELIFDRFAQEVGDTVNENSKGGIGLGLAICKEIIVQHQGRIWAESELGKGSSFSFTLPVSPRAPSRHTKTILVVDDEDEISKMMQMYLTQQGYRVLVSKNGRHAIRLITDNGVKIDLAFIDLMLPGASGAQVIQSLQEYRPSVPFIVITAYSNNASLFEGIDVKPLAVVPKPFQMEQLQNLLNKVLPVPEKDLV